MGDGCPQVGNAVTGLPSRPGSVSHGHIGRSFRHRQGLFMSTKSVPGDGEHGKGSKGMPLGEPRRHAVEFVRELIRGLRVLRRR